MATEWVIRFFKTFLNRVIDGTVNPSRLTGHITSIRHLNWRMLGAPLRGVCRCTIRGLHCRNSSPHVERAAINYFTAALKVTQRSVRARASVCGPLTA